MYEIIGWIFAIATVVTIISEVLYHAYKMYMVWVDDESIWEYHIDYDPCMKRGTGYYTSRDNDGGDITMSIILRILALALAPAIVGFAWPLVGVILVVVGLAKYHKHIHTLKKEANNGVERGI